MTNIELGASYPFWENRQVGLISSEDPLQIYFVDRLDYSSSSPVPNAMEVLWEFETMLGDVNDNDTKLLLVYLMRQIMNYTSVRSRLVSVKVDELMPLKEIIKPFFVTLCNIFAQNSKWHAWQIAIARQCLLELGEKQTCGPLIKLQTYTLELCSEAEVKFLTAIQENDMVLVDGHLLVKSHRESNKDVRGYLAGLCIRNATYPNGTYFQSGVWYCPTDRKAVRESFELTGNVDLAVSPWVPIRPFYPSNLENEQLAEFVAKVKNLISNNYFQLKL